MASENLFKDLHERARLHVLIGLCRSCTNKVEPDRKHCQYHLDYYKVRARKIRNLKKKNKICLELGCNRLIFRNHINCVKHYLANNNTFKYRKRAFKNKLCEVKNCLGFRLLRQYFCQHHMENKNVRTRNEVGAETNQHL